jgi:hypothetical protein
MIAGIKMKTIIIILTVSTAFFIRQAIDEKELIGTWAVTKAFDETNKPCDKTSLLVKEFKLKFLSADSYEMTTNYGDKMQTNGKYTVDQKNKILTLTFKSGNSSYSSKIPIVSQSKDILIINYNLCGRYDSTSVATGRLELRKM